MGADIKIYSVEDLLKERQQIGKEPFVVQGTPTGLYADRASYGNRPTLAFILDHKLICQAFCFKTSEKFFAPETTRLLERAISEHFESDLPAFDRENPGLNNEYLAIAAACLDDAIRHQTAIKAVGALRRDGIMEIDGLHCRQYTFYFAPHNYDG